MPWSHITVASPLAAHRADRQFFKTHPDRWFLARPYAEGDMPFPPSIVVFANDGTGMLAEVSLVVTKRIKGGRIRHAFSVSDRPALKTDSQIREFLWSRGINPATLKYEGPRHV